MSDKDRPSDEELEKIRTAQQLDQNIPMMCDFYATLWYKLYEELLSRGFTSDQSIELVKTFIQKS